MRYETKHTSRRKRMAEYKNVKLPLGLSSSESESEVMTIGVVSWMQIRDKINNRARSRQTDSGLDFIGFLTDLPSSLCFLHISTALLLSSHSASSIKPSSPHPLASCFLFISLQISLPYNLFFYQFAFYFRVFFSCKSNRKTLQFIGLLTSFLFSKITAKINELQKEETGNRPKEITICCT